MLTQQWKSKPSETILIIKNILIFLTVLGFLIFLFSKKMRSSRTWCATVTPLASIIGSGFLVIAPLLAFTVGHQALLAVVVLIVLGYFCGDVIRFNILHLEPLLDSQNTNSVVSIERLSKISLTFAYVISITFYLKLLASFVLKGVHLENLLITNILTTVLLLFIMIVGRWRGLSLLEKLEEYSVNVKLAIIAGLIIGLLYFNLDLFWSNEWNLLIPEKNINLDAVRTLMGTLIVVQGFETSRFLGSKYSAKERIFTMRLAQIISGLIYFVFVALIMAVFSNTTKISDTEIIDLSGRVSSVLPKLLILAAVMSQFSAAVADTVGSGGLLHETFKSRLSLSNSYFLIGTFAIILTWSADIFEIVNIASRAFALYYGLQSIIAALIAWQKKTLWKSFLFACLFIVLLLIALYGLPAKV